VPVAQWLDWAGLQLDEPLNRQPGWMTEHETMPREALLRITGVTLKVNLLQYNYGLEKGVGFHRHPHCVLQVSEWAEAGSGGCGLVNGRKRVCALTPTVQLEPIFERTTAPAVVSTFPGAMRNGRSTLDLFSLLLNTTTVDVSTVDFTTTSRASNGIAFEFSVGGEIGKFDIGALIIALTSGLVLSSLAGTLVQVSRERLEGWFASESPSAEHRARALRRSRISTILPPTLQLFAMFGRGARSEVYYSVIREVVDYRRIFARFALRCLTSAYIYAQVDGDGSGSIDAPEMYHVLAGIFGGRLNENELIALTDFVMTTVGDADEPLYGSRPKARVDGLGVKGWGRAVLR